MARWLYVEINFRDTAADAVTEICVEELAVLKRTLDVTLKKL